MSMPAIPTAHAVSEAIVSIVDVLPQEPSGSQHLHFTMQLASLQLMSASEKAQVLNEVCEATQQLALVKEKLVTPMGEDASTLALSVLSTLMNGSKATKRAILCPEVLNFMRWVIQTYGPRDQLQRGASALTLIVCHCCQPHPHDFQKAFLEASPEHFITTIGKSLPEAAALDVSPRSFAFQSLRLIRHLIALVEGEARDVVLKPCCDRIWPVVVDMLMKPQIPETWLVDDIPYDRGGPGEFPSFVGALIFVVRCFHRVKSARLLEASGSSDVTDSDRPSVHFSNELLSRLRELSGSRRMPESVRSSCKEVLSMRMNKGFRRALKAHDQEWQDTAKSLCREEALEWTICGYAECGAQETVGMKFQKCGGCKVQSYCSKACQKKDWKRHKLCCHQTC